MIHHDKNATIKLTMGGWDSGRDASLMIFDIQNLEEEWLKERDKILLVNEEIFAGGKILASQLIHLLGWKPSAEVSLSDVPNR